MGIASTPSLGLSTNANGGLVGPVPFWDEGRNVPSPQPGSVVTGADGAKYILAKATGVIPPNTNVILTEPAMTVAAGAGDWYSQTTAIPINNYAWFRASIQGGGGQLPADFSVAMAKTADGSVGQTYTATPSSGGSYAYQWYWLAGADIAGATSQSYVAQTSDIGKVLACRVSKAGMTAVSAASIGWVLAAASLLWQMNSTAGTTNNGSTNVTFSSDGSKIEAAFQGVSASAYIGKAAVAVDTPANLGTMVLFAELDAQASFQNISAININPVVGGTQYSAPSGVVSKSITPNTSRGKLVHSVRADQITTFGGLGSSSIDIRVQFGSSGGSSAPNAAKPKAYAVARNADGIPTYVLTWDDGRQSIKDWIAPQLQSRGIASTFFIPPGNIGVGGFMSEADAISLPALGMEIGIDGTFDDSVMTTQPDMATVLAGIDNMWAWLAARGLTTDARFNFCYPNGSTRVVGTISTIAAVTANGTSTLTWSTGETVAAGVEVSGFGIPYDTVVDVGGTGSCTLKNRTTNNPVTVAAQTKQASFTVTTSPFYSGKLQDALKAKGMRLGRGTNNGNTHTRYGFFDQGLILPGNSMSSTGGNGTAAQMNAVVEAAKTNKVTAIAYGHNAVDTVVSGLDTLKSELSSHFDYLAAEVQAQRIQVLSMGQLWARDGGASYPGLSF